MWRSRRVGCVPVYITLDTVLLVSIAICFGAWEKAKRSRARRKMEVYLKERNESLDLASAW